MGMAASQARHLALVARKSNCEYEGQQINQARTALANQSANLFNQMLGLEVPVPPSTQDFTKTQYSYNDGVNASTIDSWQQLANPEEEYNYVVTSHYYTDVYTGSQKKMSDPQVQYSKTGTIVSAPEMTTALRQLTAARQEYDKIDSEYNKIVSNYETAVTASEVANTAYDLALATKTSAKTAYDSALEDFNTAKNNANKYKTDTFDPARTSLDNALTAYHNAQDALRNVENYKYSDRTYSDTDIRQAPSGSDTKYTIGSNSYIPIEECDNTVKENISASLTTLFANGAIQDNAEVYYDNTNGYLVFKNDLDNLVKKQTDKLPIYGIGDETQADSIRNKSKTLNNNIDTTKTAYEQAEANFVLINDAYIDLLEDMEDKNIALNTATTTLEEADKALTSANLQKTTAEANLAVARNALTEAETEHGPTISAYEDALAVYESYQIPSYIGNCELTLLESLTSNQSAELKQVIASMKDQEINSAINNCFDEDGNYLGGVYQFKLNGVIYYTCYDDLNESYTSGTGINHIDGQTKLAYYNSSYVSTKIEKTEKALLETDGNGRFVSVRFGDDSATYTLNMETITDDVAYQDAMNEYYYANAKYDKMVQDINAKTSIIQQEDQQLELRLKQLDTERTALSTEIEAVSKIVKENVESTFKTFNS